MATAAKKAKRRPGQPTKYTPALGAKIAELLATGKTLDEIAKGRGVPCVRTILRWALDKNHEFCQIYARARMCQAEIRVDEIFTIADDGSNDTYEDENGNKKTDWDIIARSRLRVDTRKWYASKILSKLYGDKIQVDADIDDKRQQTRERDAAASKKFLKLQAEVMAEEKKKRAGARTTRPKPALNGKNGSNGANGRN